MHDSWRLGITCPIDSLTGDSDDTVPQGSRNNRFKAEVGEEGGEEKGSDLALLQEKRLGMAADNERLARVLLAACRQEKEATRHVSVGADSGDVRPR